VAAREAAVRHPDRRAVVVQGTGAKARRFAPGQLDVVGDQDQPLALGAGCHANHGRIHVHAVANQITGQPVVAQGDTRQARRAMVQRTHGVEQVCHVAGAALHCILHLLGAGRAVAQGDGDAPPFQRGLESGGTLDLRRKGDHPHPTPAPLEHFFSLAALECSDAAPRLRPRGSGVDPGALQVDADRHGGTGTATVQQRAQAAHVRREFRPGPGHGGGQERRGSMTQQALACVIQSLREVLGTTEGQRAVEVQVDEARREPAPAEVDGPGVGRDRLADSEPRHDPPALDQKRAGRRSGRLGVQKQRVAHHQAFHSARILPLSSSGVVVPIHAC
jgi:hypothetical protein